jgi:hypothetical protein
MVGEVFDRQELQHLVGPGAERAFLVRDTFAAEPRVPEAFARLAGRHHHQVLAAGHGVEFVRDLERAQEALGEQLMRGEAGDILPVHDHGAGGGWKNARDHVEKRGFSRAVGADETGYGAGLDPERSPVDGMKAAEMLVDVANLDHTGAPLNEAARCTTGLLP